MILISSYLIYLAFVLLSLTLNKHCKEVLNKNKKILTYIFASLASMCLIISLSLLISTLGVSLGLTYFVGCIGLVIVLIALLYTYKPKLIIKLSLFLFISTVILTFI